MFMFAIPTIALQIFAVIMVTKFSRSCTFAMLENHLLNGCITACGMLSIELAVYFFTEIHITVISSFVYGAITVIYGFCIVNTVRKENFKAIKRIREKRRTFLAL